MAGSSEAPRPGEFKGSAMSLNGSGMLGVGDRAHGSGFREQCGGWIGRDDGGLVGVWLLGGWPG